MKISSSIFCVVLLLNLYVASISCNSHQVKDQPKEGRSDAAPMRTPRFDAYVARYDSIAKTKGFDSTRSEKIVAYIDSLNRNNLNSLSKNLKVQDVSALLLDDPNAKRPENDSLWFDYTLRKANSYIRHFTSPSNRSSPINMALSDGGSELTDIATIERGVTWLFDEGGDNPPTRIEGYLSPVSVFGVPLIRGMYTARGCGNWAVLQTVLGDEDGGLSWLKAAQAHTPEVSNLFEKYPEYTLSYTIKTYGQRALIENGYTYYSAGLLIKAFLEKSFKNYSPPPFPSVYNSDGARETAGGARGGGRN